MPLSEEEEGTWDTDMVTRRGEGGVGTEAEMGASVIKPRMAAARLPSSLKPGERPEPGSPSETPGGTRPADTLTLDFWPPGLWEKGFLLL